MLLGTQYYRPPFPLQKHWQDDLSRMRDAGLNAIQLWACWGWIEAQPGTYRFDDYDQLLFAAGQRGLGTVISTIAEIHPFWIHRVIPGSQMIDAMGHHVISSLRGECNVGLTPGGCTDHPHVLERMGAFLTALSGRYSQEKHLLAWDCWNETRWAVNADGFVCYCEHTLNAFRGYLKECYAGLDGLNAAWQRRYCCWEDVMPGKELGRPYTDMLEFERFLTWRAAQHMAFRKQQIRAQDALHPIVAHCGDPATLSPGSGYEQALSRGNDWDLVETLDGFGCSHFPVWHSFQEADFGVRVESLRSAARGKSMWISELQGGSARDGFVGRDPVPATMQQRWVWGGYGRGADAVFFWCWRDEVFGSESSGFGLSGNDGFSAERLAALAHTRKILDAHQPLLAAYRPDAPEVGVLFTEENYHLDWAQYGPAASQASNSFIGYLRGLERIQVPYEVVDSDHLDVLDELAVLLMPWPLIVPPQAAERILQWVHNGGTLLVESEVDAFDQRGFYRDPGDERPFARTLGLQGQGRRPCKEQELTVELAGTVIQLRPSTWLEPLVAEDSAVCARMGSNEPVLVRKQLGRGQVLALGTFAGQAYALERYPGFEQFLRAIVASGQASPALSVDYPDGEVLTWRSGRSGSARLLFVTNAAEERTVTFSAPAAFFGSQHQVENLATGTFHVIEDNAAERCLTVTLAQDSYAIYMWHSED